jgi:hypothetical protein
MATYWKVAYDSGELGSAQTSVTISSLDGNTDGEYQLITRIINGYNGAVNYGVRLNNDTGSNYGRQTQYATSTTAAAVRTAESYNRIGYVSAQNQVNTYIYNIFPKSGYTRTAIGKGSFEVSGTTVGYVALDGLSWSNTADNITSIVVLADQTNGIGVGSRIILLKKTTVLDTSKTWEQVYTHTVTGSAESSFGVNTLTGNSDVVYRVSGRIKNGQSGAPDYYIRFNSDSGSNYGMQRFTGTNTTVAASQSAVDGVYIPSASALNDYVHFEGIIYAKSGKIRTIIIEGLGAISSTTVSQDLLNAYSWNNTADEITNISFFGTGSNGFGVGSEVSIERLNL